MQTQEVAIKSSVKVVMKSDTEMLDEVMVVAFGTAKKSAFTGSAKVVGTEKLEQSQVTNVTDALAAFLPQPTGSAALSSSRTAASCFLPLPERSEIRRLWFSRLPSGIISR